METHRAPPPAPRAISLTLDDVVNRKAFSFLPPPATKKHVFPGGPEPRFGGVLTCFLVAGGLQAFPG